MFAVFLTCSLPSSLVQLQNIIRSIKTMLIWYTYKIFSWLQIPSLLYCKLTEQIMDSLIVISYSYRVSTLAKKLPIHLLELLSHPQLFTGSMKPYKWHFVLQTNSNYCCRILCPDQNLILQIFLTISPETPLWAPYTS